MNNTKIIKLLLTRQAFTIKKIAETLRINYRTAYETVIQLEKDGLIKVTKAGNAKLCELTNKFNPEPFHAEFERNKMSTIQYKTLEIEKQSKAETSLQKAKEFAREMEKLLVD
ncbi:helix-turn-helix transcriptional regulator [Candidatus Woesearchaeota archaeon]|nr:helix-turn-helix transcriptional regulator [Candidatus Woesearchaeota archaeon]